MDFEFLKYEPVIGEKHIGIASIRLFKKLVLRYKIFEKKDGTGIYPMPASYKVVDGPGEERYVQAFIFDLQSDNEEVTGRIKANVKKTLPAPSNSVFSVSAVSSQVEPPPLPPDSYFNSAPPEPQLPFGFR